MAEGEGTPSGEVSELGTGRAEDDDGNEPVHEPEPGVVGGGDQGGHPGALGGEPAPDIAAAAAVEGHPMSEDEARIAEADDEEDEDEDEDERFYSELDWDDIAEAFIGALLAGLVLLVIAGALRRGRRRDH